MFAKKWFRVLLVVFLALLPLAIVLLYREFTKLPETIRIASQRSQGSYSKKGLRETTSSEDCLMIRIMYSRK